MEQQTATKERRGRIGERDIGVIAWMRLARVYHLVDRATVELVKRYELTTAQFDVIAQVGAQERGARSRNSLMHCSSPKEISPSCSIDSKNGA